MKIIRVLVNTYRETYYTVTYVSRTYRKYTNKNVPATVLRFINSEQTQCTVCSPYVSEYVAKL